VVFSKKITETINDSQGLGGGGRATPPLNEGQRDGTEARRKAGSQRGGQGTRDAKGGTYEKTMG